MGPRYKHELNLAADQPLIMLAWLMLAEEQKQVQTITNHTVASHGRQVVSESSGSAGKKPGPTKTTKMAKQLAAGLFL